MRHNLEWIGAFQSRTTGFCAILVLMAGLLWPWHLAAAGTWVPLNNQAPDSIDTMLLLPDGTVMATAGNNGLGNGWYRLTPDSHGSYVNGTWTALAAMSYTRLYYASQVLKNGQVLVAGGEYGTGSNSAEIYNPQFNTWTATPPPPSGQMLFYDNISETISNGNVLVSPVWPATYGGTDIYDIHSGTWEAGPTLVNVFDEDEASWVKLPDNSILTIDSPVDIPSAGTNSERYIPSLNQWVNDSIVPVPIYDVTNAEMGPAFLLPNGTAIFPGATGNTAIYTPSGSTSKGTWATGPALPSSMVTADSPGAMMVNGKILFTMSAGVFNSPTYFYEYDSVANSFTQVNAPTGPTFNDVTFGMRMLDLPDGTVLFSDSGPQLYVYQPDGSPLPAGQPAINTLTANSDGSYHLTGTLFNGISEGAAYGDDAQMDSNYPLVRMTNSAGTVLYARTYNWSSTGVMTGTNVVSTDFVLPANFQPAVCSLVVSANGNASAPVSFNYFDLAPDALLIESTNLLFSGIAAGPFAPVSLSLTLTNIGASSLNWTLSNASSWMNVSSASNSLSSNSAETVTVSLNATANALLPGIYTNTLLFTNLSDHLVQSRTITLQVNQLVQNGGFETGDFTSWVLDGTLDGNEPNINFVTNVTYYYIPAISPYSGDYCALMGPSGFLSYLSQTLNTVSGRQYVFSSWVNSPDGATPNECSISWNGNTLFDEVNMPAIGWTNLSFVVTATGSSTAIQFGIRDDNSLLGLDDVSVIPVLVQVPVFQSVTASKGSINLTWSAAPGTSYQLQYSTNLIQNVWLNLGSQTNATGSNVTVTDTSPSDRQRFYRIAVP